MSSFDFWYAQLAGENPETTPGEPHVGYYLSKEYVAIPGGAKRVLIDFPCAIWHDSAGIMLAKIDRLNRSFTLHKMDEIDDLFAKSCRNAITYEKYLEMIARLKEFAA